MKGLVATLTAVVCLVGGAPAEARYYLSERDAERYTRRYFHHVLGYHYTAAQCRPQGHDEAAPGYVYHRWTCVFAVGDDSLRPSCYGRVLITGSSTGRGAHYRRRDFSRGECPRG